MKSFFKCFLFLFICNIYATNNSIILKKNSIELKGKLSTQFILAAISKICYDTAKVVVDPTPQNKLEGTLNIIGTTLEVAAQAASKEEKEKKSVVSQDILIDMKTLLDGVNEKVDQDVESTVIILLDLFKIIDKNNEVVCLLEDEESKQNIKMAISYLNEWLKKTD